MSEIEMAAAGAAVTTITVLGTCLIVSMRLNYRLTRIVQRLIRSLSASRRAQDVLDPPPRYSETLHSKSDVQ